MGTSKWWKRYIVLCIAIFACCSALVVALLRLTALAVTSVPLPRYNETLTNEKMLLYVALSQVTGGLALGLAGASLVLISFLTAVALPIVLARISAEDVYVKAVRQLLLWASVALALALAILLAFVTPLLPVLQKRVAELATLLP